MVAGGVDGDELGGEVLQVIGGEFPPVFQLALEIGYSVLMKDFFCCSFTSDPGGPLVVVIWGPVGPPNAIIGPDCLGGSSGVPPGVAVA